MKVLGIDPGFRNLGLTIVDLKSMTILHSENMTVGHSDNILSFIKFLHPKLTQLHKEYNFMGIGAETPPFIMKQIKTTAGLWAVVSIIVSWAYERNIPFRHASPISLKRAVVQINEGQWNRKKIPKKAEVKVAIKKLYNNCCKTSHEDDAALAAAVTFGEINAAT